jgi:hypothetical protein
VDPVEGVSLCLQESASEGVWSQWKVCHCVYKSPPVKVCGFRRRCVSVFKRGRQCSCVGPVEGVSLCLQESASEGVWIQTKVCQCLKSPPVKVCGSRRRCVTVFTRDRQ